MNMRSFVAFSLLCLGSVSANAGENRYLAVGDPENRFTEHIMEVWGVGDYARYANPSTYPGDSFGYLTSSISDRSDLVNSRITEASLSFGYDPLGTAIRTSASGRAQYYKAGDASFAFSTIFGTHPVLSSYDNQAVVSVSSNRSRQTVNVFRATATVEGSLPNQPISYSAPTSTEFTVDLVDLLGSSAYYSNGFDLSDFDTLLVRLTTPTFFKPVGVGGSFTRRAVGGNFDTSLPSELTMAEFGAEGVIYEMFDGVYKVSVDDTDYASSLDFLTAKSWVDSNIRQINYEFTAYWSISSLSLTSAVPEPEAGVMWAFGLMFLGLRGMRRNQNIVH